MWSMALVSQSSARRVKKLKHHVKQRVATFSTHRHQIIWKPRFVLIVCLKFSLFKKHAIQIFLKEMKCGRNCHCPPIFLIATKAYNKMSSENLKLQFQADQKFMSSQRGVAFFWTLDMSM